MKKKGFTLIELLAVIVILAIIALIATPLVLKYIEKSRKESKVDSAYSFVRNLEIEIANYSIKKNGVKYKAPVTIDDFLNQDKLSESGLNLKVKGESPSNIKVCLSTNGLVQKGMFEYGKYYVLYDGKKATSSDKATFDIFTCSSDIGSGNGTGNGGSGSENNAGGGTDNGDNATDNDIGENVSVLTMTFTEASSDFEYDYMGITDENVNELVSKITTPNNYYLTITDPGTNEVVAKTELYVNMDNGMLLMSGPADGNGIIYTCGIMDGQLIILTNIEIVGEYIVTFSSLNNGYIPYVMRIDDRDDYWISGTNFVIGDAKVTITDNYNNVYLNEVILNFNDDGFGLIGFSSYGNNNLSLDIEGIYDAIAEGKIITTKIVQNVDGKEVVTIIGGVPPTYQKEYFSISGSLYYWGNACFPSST